MTDPRDVRQATDDELRAAAAAAEARVRHGPDDDTPDPAEPVLPASEVPVTDPRDLDWATGDELRAAEAAASVRVHRSHDGDSGNPPQTRPEQDETG